MTIATRNRLIRSAIVFSAIFSVIAVTCVILLITRLSLPLTMSGTRQLSILDSFKLFPYSPIASLLGLAFFPLFSLFFLIYLLFTFEKTQTVEITFFAASIFIVSLESLRLFIPLYQLHLFSGFFSMTISRISLFSRIFFILSLLSSGIFSTGQTIQKLGSGLFLLVFVSFSLSNAIPVNSGNNSSNFLSLPGYPGTLSFLFVILCLLTALSYIILGKNRSSKDYSLLSLASTMLLAGYSTLAFCDSWIFFIVGETLFFLGTWMFLGRMHRYYLWQ